jgi:predicted Zn-dependent peptidase
MTRTLVRGSLLTLGLLGAALNPAAAQAPAGVGDFDFETYSLDNGLKVILVPDHTTPTVAVDIWYNVGARNERPGRTGFAHLFEHMMFEGSANVAKGEHMNLLQRAGSSNFNGTTSEDRTNYYEMVPPNRVNLALWLEADRMRSLNVSAENLKNQQEVVKEEKRQRVDNAPYAPSLRALVSEVSYNPQGCFSYAHQTIGSMADLDAARLEDVQDFFRTYYAPNNATLVLVGDFDPAQVKGLVQEYFGSIPRVEPAAEVTCTDAFSHLPVRRTIEDRNANLPAYMVAYGGVAFNDPDSYALDLLATILGGGESSRLNQRMVKGERAATFAFSGSLQRRGPGIVAIYAMANQGVDAARLERLANEEVEKIRTRGVTQAELDGAKARWRASTIRGLQTAFGKAEVIQQYNLFAGDPNGLTKAMNGYMAVTRADIQRVAQKYLVPSNAAVLLTVPAAPQS